MSGAGSPSGGSRGEAREARPLFLDQTKARRDEKKFLKTSPTYLRVWMTGFPPSLYLKVWIRP